MKSPHFFIEKATELINEIDTILAEPLSVRPKWMYPLNVEGNEEDYGKNINKIEPIYDRTQLMFGEFDNNVPFIDKIKDLKPLSFTMMDGVEILKKIKSLIEFFVDHVREYRIE